MLNKSFLQKISKYISENSLLRKDCKYLVALSGGADSVILALTLKELGYKIEAAHCNFNLRGEESKRDENFCTDFCKKNDIALHTTHFDTISFAQLRKISIEMAARRLRYSFFDSLLKDLDMSAVCVAHHQDDSVETVLLNLIRGTGIHGLTGIKPQNGNIIRPLLCVTRKEIEDTLHDAKQGFVIDSTNLIDDVIRNKIRLDILPIMKRINPNINESIAKTAKRIGAIVNATDELIENAKNRIVIKECNGRIRLNTTVLQTETLSEEILFNILRDYTFNPPQIEQIHQMMETEPGKVFFSQTHQLLIDRNCIIIEPFNYNGSKRMIIPEEGVYAYGEDVKFRIELIDCKQGITIQKESNCCYADISKIQMPLTVRNTVNGDRFIPFGMNGSKLVSDYLTDKKMNLFDKQRQLVITDAKDNIIWLVSQRPDNRYRITKTTETVLKITRL